MDVAGDESGSPPGDRLFRPDVEGLRAVAILLVVLFHVGIQQASGGFTGVDVFFVISGYVITGLLLRERPSTVGSRLAAFYARRARRILPMALLVAVAALTASYLISRSYGTLVGSDTRWTALFVGNFHFAHVYPNYLVTRPPSPLQQYWSLGVEEQFYLVWPAMFLLLATASRWSMRTRLNIGLAVVMVASLSISIITSHSGQLGAYDSSLTRAWELGAGALLAVNSGQLNRIPSHVAATMTWTGLLAILAGAYFFTVLTPFPGIAAIVPVGGTALVIAGGTPVPHFGVERLLRTLPFRWIGRWSYSWYLWHWPVLVLAAQVDHTTVANLGIGKNLGLVTGALALSALTYALIENPIRHARVLQRSPYTTLIGAASVVVACVGLTYIL